MSQRRIYQNNYPYLLTTNLNHREWLFNEPEIASVVAKNIFKKSEFYRAELYGYCIMPNHLHILVQFRGKYDVSNYMHDLKSISATEMRENIGLNIQLWKKRFYDQVISNKCRFLRARDYLINNHKRWDLSTRYAKYPYLYINDELIDISYSCFN